MFQHFNIEEVISTVQVLRKHKSIYWLKIFSIQILKYIVRFDAKVFYFLQLLVEGVMCWQAKRQVMTEDTDDWCFKGKLLLITHWLKFAGGPLIGQNLDHLQSSRPIIGLLTYFHQWESSRNFLPKPNFSPQSVSSETPVNDHCWGWVTPFQWTGGMRQRNMNKGFVLYCLIGGVEKDFL